MTKFLWPLLMLALAGCSNKSMNSLMEGHPSVAVAPSNSHYMRDALAIGTASVVLGSLALGNFDASFKATREGWFEKNTKYAGIDKMGHVWYGAAIADVLFERSPNKPTRTRKSAAMASAVSFGIMAMVEISDGFADNEVGFSFEDIVANAAGVGFSYLRNISPGLRQLVDYRMEYLPNHSVGDWAIDTFYSDQKYMLAWKLSGIDVFRNSPLRFFEIHTGYYARGFSARELEVQRQRNGFVGVGVNLSEIFRFGRGNEISRVARPLNYFFEHIQVPYTRVEAPVL